MPNLVKQKPSLDEEFRKFIRLNSAFRRAQSSTHKPVMSLYPVDKVKQRHGRIKITLEKFRSKGKSETGILGTLIFFPSSSHTEKKLRKQSFEECDQIHTGLAAVHNVTWK